MVPVGFRCRVSWMAQGHASRSPLDCVESLRCLMTWRTRLALHVPNEDTSFRAPAAANPDAFAVAFHEVIGRETPDTGRTQYFEGTCGGWAVGRSGVESVERRNRARDDVARPVC